MKQIEDLNIDAHWGSFDRHLSTYASYWDSLHLKIRNKGILDGYLTDHLCAIDLTPETATQLRDKLNEFIRNAKKVQKEKGKV